MLSHRMNRRIAGFVAFVGGVLLVATACEPLKNAPPGGGETITQTFRYGPFTLGPGQEAMGSPSSGMPRPAGAFGLKSAKFDVVDASGTPLSVHDVHLHHIVMTTSAREDQLCPGRRSDSSARAWSARRSTSGDRTRTWSLPTSNGARSTT